MELADHISEHHTFRRDHRERLAAGRKRYPRRRHWLHSGVCNSADSHFGIPIFHPMAYSFINPQPEADGEDGLHVVGGCGAFFDFGDNGLSRLLLMPD